MEEGLGKYLALCKARENARDAPWRRSTKKELFEFTPALRLSGGLCEDHQGEAHRI
ncbi:MAG: hypothetical protein AAF647_08645 [Pseudomonadota bacterium]